MSRDDPKLVALEPQSPVPHPPYLGEHGRALWNAVQAQYHVDDAGGVAMLIQACRAADRAEACRAIIDRDGELVRTRAGDKEHPLLKAENAARSLVLRALTRLGLDLEPVRAGPGRPPGQRGV